MAADNKTLGRFMLDGIIPAPRGMPQIEVSFDIDANGIVSVKAHDKGTGKEQKIVITASSGLSKEEVEKMQRDAEAYAEEDSRKREEVETKNVADTLAYTAEKTLREQGDKVPADVRPEVEGKVKALKKAMEGGDAAAIRQQAEALSQVLQKAGAAMYEAAGPAAPPPSGGDGGDEDVVEGEFSEA